MANLANAVVLGALTGGGVGGIVFPIVLVPVYGVPRGFLIHSYSLIGLLRKPRNSRGARSRCITGWTPLAHEHHTLPKTNAPSFAADKK
jgi:hypothetical protein